jgi:hypothetical protein
MATSIIEGATYEEYNNRNESLNPGPFRNYDRTKRITPPGTRGPVTFPAKKLTIF